MIIVLKPHTTKDDVSRVENMVKKRGLDTHIVQGKEMTVIGCIGDTAKVDSKLFEIDSAVDKVMHVQEPYKLANRAFHPEDSIINVSGVKVGGDRLLRKFLLSLPPQLLQIQSQLQTFWLLPQLLLPYLPDFFPAYSPRVIPPFYHSYETSDPVLSGDAS